MSKVAAAVQLACEFAACAPYYTPLLLRPQAAAPRVGGAGAGAPALRTGEAATEPGGALRPSSPGSTVVPPPPLLLQAPQPPRLLFAVLLIRRLHGE